MEGVLPWLRRSIYSTAFPLVSRCAGIKAVCGWPTGGAQEVVAVDGEGRPEVMARVGFPAFPMCIDWLPDGRWPVVAARGGRLLRQEPDGVAGDPRRPEWLV